MENEDTLAFQVEQVSGRAFSFVPLPWRVVMLTGAGILCWASNLHLLHLMGIDTPYILDMHIQTNVQPPRFFSPTSPTPPYFGIAPKTSGRLYPAVYKLFAAYAAWSFGCWLFFRVLCGGNIQMMDHYKVIPEICTIGLLAALVCPFNVVRKRERDLFLQ